MSPCRILEGVDRLWIQRGIVFGAADQIATPQEESPIEPGNPATWRDRRCALDPARIVLMGKVAYSVVSAQWTIVHVFLPHHGLLLPHHGLRDCLPCADAGPSRRSIAPLNSGLNVSAMVGPFYQNVYAAFRSKVLASSRPPIPSIFIEQLVTEQFQGDRYEQALRTFFELKYPLLRAYRRHRCISNPAPSTTWCDRTARRSGPTFRSLLSWWTKPTCAG